MVKYITEILSDINKNTQEIVKYKDNYAIKTIFAYAFDPSMKMILPEGAPPYKKDAAPLGMSQANFYQQVKKLYIFKREDITKVRREQLFVQLLESLHPTEADVCIAVKDQTLEKMYPNITRKLLEDNGFIPKLEIKVTKKTETKSKGKHLVLNLSDSTTTKESFGTPSKAPVTESQEETTKRPRGRPRKTQ